MINVPGAMWGDVFCMGDGTIGCAYDLGNKIAVEAFRYTARGKINIARAMKVFEFPEQVLFVRADIDSDGIIVMGQGNPSGKLYCNRALPWELNTYGTHSADILVENGRAHYVCQISTTEYYDSLTNTTHPIPDQIRGTSNGIIQLLPGGFIVWADLARASVAEMYYPFEVHTDLFVGEGAADPPHIQALESNEQKNIYNGYAARPRCAYDEPSNTLAVVARSEHGVNFHFFHLPLVDLTPPEIVEPPEVIPPEVIPPETVDPEEPEDMACTPVVPGQDVIQKSLDSLRNFCQTYTAPPHALPEYAGKKCYSADEIHENGLFIADGLIYFMMSDTGNWAKTLMNPDDKRDWESKRVSADNALFDYMKRRVGDAPASSAPGGTLSGEVNV